MYIYGHETNTNERDTFYNTCHIRRVRGKNAIFFCINELVYTLHETFPSMYMCDY